MKQWLIIGGLIILAAIMAHAVRLGTVYNPFTQRNDFINTDVGSGASSGTIIASPQNYVTFYNTAGSSNILNGFSGLTVNATTGVTVSTMNASTGTVNVLNTSTVVVHGRGAGGIAFREGLESTVKYTGAGVSVIWASTETHWTMFNPGGVSTFSIVGSSSPITNGNIPLWAGQFSIYDSGLTPEQIKYAVEPATVTYILPVGVRASTMVVTSTASFPFVSNTVFANVSTVTLTSAYADFTTSTGVFGGFTASTFSLLSGGSAGQTLCWKSATTLGYCSSVVGVGGACTCN